MAYYLQARSVCNPGRPGWIIYKFSRGISPILGGTLRSFTIAVSPHRDLLGFALLSSIAIYLRGIVPYIRHQEARWYYTPAYISEDEAVKVTQSLVWRLLGRRDGSSTDENNIAQRIVLDLRQRGFILHVVDPRLMPNGNACDLVAFTLSFRRELYDESSTTHSRFQRVSSLHSPHATRRHAVKRRHATLFLVPREPAPGITAGRMW